MQGSSNARLWEKGREGSSHCEDEESGIISSVTPLANLSSRRHNRQLTWLHRSILYYDGEGAGGGRVCARARAAASVGGSAVLLAREAVLQALH